MQDLARYLARADEVILPSRRSAEAPRLDISPARKLRVGVDLGTAYLAAYAVGQFWNIFEFSGRADPTNPNTGVAVWSLDLRQQSTGELTWYVYDNAGSRELKPSNPVVAPIRWWHLSVAGFASRPSYVRRPTAPVG